MDTRTHNDVAGTLRSALNAGLVIRFNVASCQPVSYSDLSWVLHALGEPAPTCEARGNGHEDTAHLSVEQRRLALQHIDDLLTEIYRDLVDVTSHTREGRAVSTRIALAEGIACGYAL